MVRREGREEGGKRRGCELEGGREDRRGERREGGEEGEERVRYGKEAGHTTSLWLTPSSPLPSLPPSLELTCTLLLFPPSSLPSLPPYPPTQHCSYFLFCAPSNILQIMPFMVILPLPHTECIPYLLLLSHVILFTTLCGLQKSHGTTWSCE